MPTEQHPIYLALNSGHFALVEPFADQETRARFAKSRRESVDISHLTQEEERNAVLTAIDAQLRTDLGAAHGYVGLSRRSKQKTDQVKVARDRLDANINAALAYINLTFAANLSEDTLTATDLASNRIPFGVLTGETPAEQIQVDQLPQKVLQHFEISQGDFLPVPQGTPMPIGHVFVALCASISYLNQMP